MENKLSEIDFKIEKYASSSSIDEIRNIIEINKENIKGLDKDMNTTIKSLSNLTLLCLKNKNLIRYLIILSLINFSILIGIIIYLFKLI